MACSTTECNDCDYYGTNVFLDRCPNCGSSNVDREYDVEYDSPDHFEDLVDED